MSPDETAAPVRAGNAIDDRRRRLQFRARVLALAVIGVVVVLGILPDPFLLPLFLVAGGGLLAGGLTIGLGVLLGGLGFLMFERPRREETASAGEWPDFEPPVPRTPKNQLSARVLKTARPLLVLFLLLLMLPESTGIPKLVLGSLLIAFGVGVTLALAAGMTLLAARGMRRMVRGTFGDGDDPPL